MNQYDGNNYRWWRRQRPNLFSTIPALRKFCISPGFKLYFSNFISQIFSQQFLPWADSADAAAGRHVTCTFLPLFKGASWTQACIFKCSAFLIVLVFYQLYFSHFWIVFLRFHQLHLSVLCFLSPSTAASVGAEQVKPLVRASLAFVAEQHCCYSRALKHLLPPRLTPGFILLTRITRKAQHVSLR